MRQFVGYNGQRSTEHFWMHVDGQRKGDIKSVDVTSFPSLFKNFLKCINVLNTQWCGERESWSQRQFWPQRGSKTETEPELWSPGWQFRASLPSLGALENSGGREGWSRLQHAVVDAGKHFREAGFCRDYYNQCFWLWDAISPRAQRTTTGFVSIHPHDGFRSFLEAGIFVPPFFIYWKIKAHRS